MTIYTYDNLGHNGRLGNMLWQIAATACRAHLNGGIDQVHLPPWTYRKYFNLPEMFFDPYDEGTGVQKIDGGTEYFQEYQLIQPIENLVRSWFTTKQAEYPTYYCAIHVRRGDYLKNPQCFYIMTPGYFQKAVADVISRNPGIGFKIFSDDMEWCRQNVGAFGIPAGHQIIFRDNNKETPVEVVDRVEEPSDQWDLFEISACMEHIISNSTFSWWGAYLSMNRAPIYPSMWFGPGVPNWENWELAIPPGWRKFSC